MEIDIQKLFESVSIQSENNNITFCNIYTRDGLSLTNSVLAGLSKENNLFSALESASLSGNFSIGKMKSDFSGGKEGCISFNYNKVHGTMYYVPVHNTDWILTYLIRESIISDLISSISQGIIGRSFLLSITTALILISLFAYIFIQAKKTAKITLSKEVADAENRIKQEELEEQLALQQQISRQERKRSEQDNMITALASDYRSVYYVNLDSDEGICYRKEGEIDAPFREGEHFSYLDFFY